MVGFVGSESFGFPEDNAFEFGGRGGDELVRELQDFLAPLLDLLAFHFIK